jgi:transcriptional regulator with XRE-family HTH domain
VKSRGRDGRMQVYWNAYRRGLLRRLYPMRPWHVVLHAFPETTKKAIHGQASLLGIKRIRRVDRQDAAVADYPVLRMLRDRRIKLGISQAEVAQATGWDVTRITNCERAHHTAGRRTSWPSFLMLMSWAEALGCELAIVDVAKAKANSRAVREAASIELSKYRAQLPKPERGTREFDPRAGRIEFTDPDMNRLELVRISPRQFLEMLAEPRKLRKAA